ncbi:MAG: YgjV family protein [Bacilli bacterium]|nr:YgjV family protein [Bacilli bacterium]
MLINIIIQAIGFIAWILLTISYWQKDTNKILIFHILSGIFYIIHYYMLDATVGLSIIFFEIIRDFAYYKSSLDKLIFRITIPIYILFGILSYNGLPSLMPTLASLIDGYTLTSTKNKIIIVGAIISEILWLIYNIYSKSYIGIITELIMIISNSIAIKKTILYKDN